MSSQHGGRLGYGPRERRQTLSRGVTIEGASTQRIVRCHHPSDSYGAELTSARCRRAEMTGLTQFQGHRAAVSNARKPVRLGFKLSRFVGLCDAGVGGRTGLTLAAELSKHRVARLRVCWAKPTVAEKVDGLFSHIPAIHDEGVARGDDQEVCRALDLGPINADLAVIRSWNKP